MRTFYSIIVLVALLVVNTLAQTTQTIRTSQIGTKLGAVKPSMLGSSQRTEDCDTFSNLCSDDVLVVYTTSGGGSVSGHNEYEDISKADIFKLSGSAIKGVLLYFGIGTAVDTIHQFKVRIWDNDGLFANGSTGAPGTVLAETLVKYNDVKNDVASSDMTYVEFDSEVIMPADSVFYAGINFDYIAGDAIGLITTMERQGLSCDGKMTAFEEWSPGYYGGGWYSYATWGFTGISNIIMPITCSGCNPNGLTVYMDADGDGYGNKLSSLLVTDCIVPTGYVTNDTDCNDGNSAIHPGACDGSNGVDDNCNGVIDDGSGAIIYHVDADGDGYGQEVGIYFCNNPGSGYSTNGTDCNDGNSNVNTGANEVTNGIDDNCNGIVDECNPPDGLLTKNITTDSVTFKWNNFSGAMSNKLRYKIASNGSWIQISPTGQKKRIGGLSPNTKYTWQIKSKCGGDPKITSDWSAKQFFTTAEVKFAADLPNPTVAVFPNPTSGSAIISFSLFEDVPTTIFLYDITGRKLQTVLDQNLAAGNQEIVFQRGQLSPGLYLLEVKMGEQVEVRKLLVE